MLNLLDDSKTFNRMIQLHIDEAHAYVPTHRDRVIEMNEKSIVERIYFYSATPFNIWQGKNTRSDELFKNIYIIDINEQYNIRKSQYYFGVKDCSSEIGFSEELSEYDTSIPDIFIKKYGNEKQLQILNENNTNYWYDTKYPFQIGNEVTDPTQMYLEDIFTVLANLTGNPAVSVPSKNFSNKMPHDIQLIAKNFEEEKLL